jgi:hypothetical protein
MHEIDLATGDYADMDWSGLNPSPAELAVLDQVLSEPDDADLAAWVLGLSDQELAALEHEYLAETAGDGYDGQEHANVMEDAPVYGRAEADYLSAVHEIDIELAALGGREAVRRQQDQAEQGRRRGSTEVRLHRALGRLADGTLLPGQLGLANDPDIDGLFGTGPLAGPADVAAELKYQVLGGTPPARRRPGQLLPPVGRLARNIGLK